MVAIVFLGNGWGYSPTFKLFDIDRHKTYNAFHNIIVIDSDPEE